MIKNIIFRMIGNSNIVALKYLSRYKKYTFNGIIGQDYNQYEAIITRLYHTIEKGLSYTDYRPGFGVGNVQKLIQAMENYINDGYSEDAFFYRTALSTLEFYINKNKIYKHIDNDLEKKIESLKGKSNGKGGSLKITPLSKETIQQQPYDKFVCDRHSMRHFSKAPVDINDIKNALIIAQQTPSACNRQGWRSIVISNKEIMEKVLNNQNGNEGFGNEFDKLILIVSDLRYFNRDRELFQAYIDGGMYAQSVLNSLHFQHIATVPLSASLSMKQEENIRKLLKLNGSEVLVMFIGIGNYPDECLTTMSTRRKPNIVYID